MSEHERNIELVAEHTRLLPSVVRVCLDAFRDLRLGEQATPNVAVEAAAKAIWARTRIDSFEDSLDYLAAEFCRHDARLALEAATPHVLADLLELHQEDLFRGHLSNGCKTCSGGEWPCETIRVINQTLERFATLPHYDGAEE